jgi:hypothetical protein
LGGAKLKKKNWEPKLKNKNFKSKILIFKYLLRKTWWLGANVTPPFWKKKRET